MKKMHQAVSALLIPAFLLGAFAVSPKAMADDDETGNASFTIASVSPDEFSPSQSTAITITGAGFSDGLKAGIAKEGNEITSATGLTDLEAVFSSATTLTATVPSGLATGEYDLYVYDPNQASFYYARKEGAFEVGVEVDSNTDTLGYSNSKAARRKINATFTGVNLLKKNWVKVRMNGKNVPILKVVSHKAGSGETPPSTVLKLNVKYKGWTPGTYRLTMTYKYRDRVQYYTSKGKLKHRNTWKKNNTIIADGFITITPAQ